MRKYKDLTVHEKIHLKQHAINISGDKRSHFKTPNHLQNLNELQINYLLSDYTTHSRKYKRICGVTVNCTNRSTK